MTILSRTTSAVVLTLTTAAAALGVAPSANASPFDDYFVVNTQDPEQVAESPVLDAGGAFASCDSVTDLWGLAEQIGARKLIFIGEKEVHCGDESVVIHYNATLNFESARRTSGHWYVVESTVPGITEGGGTVRGDNTRCDPIAPSEVCILDTFAGDVF